MLPANYYELSDNHTFVIPSGEINGNVTVKLNRDLFLSDSIAATPSYALPLRIISSTTDSILTEKNYTVVVVRFYNKYHGSYWLKGVDYTLDVAGNHTDTIVYRNNFV